MANLMDYCELLASEGRRAQEYTELAKKTKNGKAKNEFKTLTRLSGEKMKILHGIIKDAPWNFDFDKK